MSQLQPEHDSYAIEEPSDEEPGLSSSEDELDILLHGTQKQKLKLIRECLTGESESSSDDDFEKEMENELSSTMKTMKGSWQTAGPSSDVPAATTSSESTPQQFYDDIYFDSDSEDESSNAAVKKIKPRRKNHPVLTNDDLLYDPQEDERDQEWVDARRRRYRNMKNPKTSGRQQAKNQAIPNSDAVLNCPACMTTLCLDCQRHESYRTQYRAMFVMNCSVSKDEVLKFPDQPLKKHRRHDRKKVKCPATATDRQTKSDEMYHPVKCTECSTEVAVYDKEEVYHFFNVIASHC
ncbi:E2F-associated phospho [Pelobates cultripes]|uniref:E2F-associated phospho n=2 Tax=Pelobates cultripes TaxID=61616 RepID=A0AAD1TPD6_PELCU|nr:E2F-associated phospho [Pelobates cultripes]